MRKSVLVVAVSALAVLAMMMPAAAQQADLQKPNVCGAPIPHTGFAFRYGDLVCVLQCMKPAEWKVCTGTWWADSKDHKVRGPRIVKGQSATGKFSEPCGVVCRPPGTPRIAYQTSGVATNGERAWIRFDFPETLPAD